MAKYGDNRRFHWDQIVCYQVVVCAVEDDSVAACKGAAHWTF